MVSYLDIRITIVGQYVTAIYYYDKRDDFFFVLLIFHLCVVIIYLLMAFLMGRICDHYEDFVRKNKEVTTRIIKRGFCFSKLCKCFKKFNIRYISSKYNTTLKRHVEDGICCPMCGLPMLSNKISTQITLAMSKLFLNIVFYMWVVNPDLISLFLPLLILWYVGLILYISVTWTVPIHVCIWVSGAPLIMPESC